MLNPFTPILLTRKELHHQRKDCVLFFNVNNNTEQFYLQTLSPDKRICNGRFYALAYANIFMAELEEKYIYVNLSSTCQCYTFGTLTIYSWHEKVNMMILRHINKQHPTVKFNFAISKESASFLYTDHSLIDYRTQIIITVYNKETVCQSYSHSKSEHPLCLKKCIPFSQRCS